MVFALQARNVMPQDYIGESLYRGFQAGTGEEDKRRARNVRQAAANSTNNSSASGSASTPNVRLVPAPRRFGTCGGAAGAGFGQQGHHDPSSTATSLTLAFAPPRYSSASPSAHQ